MLFWNRIVDSVAVLVPVTYFVVALTYAGYAYLLIGASFLVFAGVAISTERIYRKQSLLMLVGGIVPTAANVSVNAGDISFADRELRGTVGPPVRAGHSTTVSVS